jgi:hypothetical protein
MRSPKFVILTLQYCLETFEQTCQCGRCDPCTRGQEDIREAIRIMEDLLHRAGQASQCENSVSDPSLRTQNGRSLADRLHRAATGANDDGDKPTYDQLKGLIREARDALRTYTLRTGNPANITSVEPQ